MTLSRRWVRGAVWVVLLMVGSVLARAQEVSGSISGTVVNASGASVSGAVVTLTNTDRAYVERTLKTDKAGLYTARSLPLGSVRARDRRRSSAHRTDDLSIPHRSGRPHSRQRRGGDSRTRGGEDPDRVAAAGRMNLFQGLNLHPWATL